MHMLLICEAYYSLVGNLMGINLQLLGLQAVPRLAKKFDVEFNDFSGFIDLYGTSPEEFTNAYEKCGKILKYLFKEFNVSWWDVYLNSDIGMERMGLARDMRLEKGDIVLDVGCGRAYFTVAATRCSRRVIGLDAMNGMSRRGWWKNFRESTYELKLTRKIRALKAHAQSIPLKDHSIDKAVAVHSVRNFRHQQFIQNALREMNRVLSKDGEMIIVENIPIAGNKAQEAHLAMYKSKCNYSSGDVYYFSQEELLRTIRNAGLRETHVEVVDYNLSATPPIFYLDTSRLSKGHIEKAQKEYAVAVDMIRKHGETSPPALIIKAVKHSK
jgi:ubiquinone/menaquinone biosynthesis C-methylase UbiE